ncbi:hypothetical protein ES708_20823 [subsurface metagenome]
MNELHKFPDKKVEKIKTLSIANKDRQTIIDKLICEGRVKDRLIESLKLEIKDLKEDVWELMYAKKRALNRIEGE